MKRPMFIKVYNSSLEMRTHKKKPFSLLLKSFQIFGVDLEGEDSSILYKVFFRSWTTLILLLYHYWFFCDIGFYFGHKAQENAIAESITVWSSVISYDILLWKGKDIRKLMAIMKEETEKLDRKLLGKQEKQVIFVFSISWLYMLIFIGQKLILTPEKGFGNRYTVNILRYLFDSLSEYDKIILFKLETALEIFFIQGFLTLTIALYLLLGLSARKWFKNLKRSYMRKRNSTETGSKLTEIEEFCNDFDKLSLNVQLLDKVFTHPVAIWLLMILVTLCVRIVAVLNPRIPVTENLLTIIIVSFSRSAMTLVGMSFIADSVNQQATKTLFYLTTLSHNTHTMSAAAYHEIHMAFTRSSLEHLPMMRSTECMTYRALCLTAGTSGR
ncbi:hypothetical protein X975_10836, partial [Stegodyphus mimosarum]